MKNNPVFFLLFLALFALALLLMLPIVMVVNISDIKGSTLIEEPINPGDRISVNYTHSVEKTYVNETYVVDNGGRLALYSAVFESSGAGLPSDASYEIEQGENGQFIIRNYDRTYDEVTYGTGNISRHRVIIDNSEYYIYDKLKENNKFTIKISRDSPINIFILHI
ncbi:conserved hypothetical protein [Methanocella paludicola SANAE]|uniref:DUF1850 domain-containing protein n=1 Tax=Methanocella paludicola (strain DSM 17711 / JCM 13418 / NBRC 101707 / SANAE) TaxID=304371 RepID=D1YY83_METPS|nr:DUF1850 domain-containing protein [Methanocella paludicola]BAI61405.1 conserved hypothetical protein [Methanocella paludicola SANAE]